MSGDKEFLLHRADEVTKAIGVIRATIERQFPPNATVETALENAEIECKMLIKSIKSTKEKT